MPQTTTSPPPPSAMLPRGRFDVWAPRAQRLQLLVLCTDGRSQRLEMKRLHDDWWTPIGEAPQSEVSYGYLIDDAATAVPDPRSLWQPDGVHALSRTFEPNAFAWSDQGWTGRALAGAVIYELHIGTFTPGGTFDSAIERLDHLVDLGIDLVEVMPVNAFNGEHGWGYDGVLWHAIHAPYGGPAGYQRFVDACHARGLGVIQDVVHNHFGPSGNYSIRFGPYLREGRSSWGDLVNLDGPGSAEVRRYIADSVRMWFVDYHVDALRLDAVHALHDSSHRHLLEELAIQTAALSAHVGRPLTLIAESDLNDTRLVAPREAGGYGLDAQWSDDFHHALRVALTGETTGYYSDFAPLAALAKVFERGFFHDGTWSSFRGREHGVPFDVERMPAWRLVVYSRNHDQIGNRAQGDPLSEHLDEDQLACAALLSLVSPFTPMLFQGEEWASTAPFQFFSSHPEPELGEAVSQGRLQEFAAMGWDPSQVANPQDPQSFLRSRLDWSQRDEPQGRRMLEVYRRLIALRRELAALTDPDLRSVTCRGDEQRRWFEVRRLAQPGLHSAKLSTTEFVAGEVIAVVNFADQPLTLGPYSPELQVAFATRSGATLISGELTLPSHGGALLA